MFEIFVTTCRPRHCIHFGRREPRSLAGSDEREDLLRAARALGQNHERDKREHELHEFAGTGAVSGSAGFLSRMRARIFGGAAGAGGASDVPRTVPMRIEPKTYFANERTFLSWLHTAVLIGTIGAGLASYHMGARGYAGGGTHEKEGQSPSNTPEAYRNLLKEAATTAGVDSRRTLTITHEHEYRVRFSSTGGAIVGGEGGDTPVVSHAGQGAATIAVSGEEMSSSSSVVAGGGGDAEFGSSGGGEEGGRISSSALIEEAVSRAVTSYLREVGDTANAIASSSLSSSNTTTNEDPADASSSSSAVPLLIAMIMLTASVLLCVYATLTFMWRGRMISKRSTVPFHDPIGPVVMGCIMIGSMVTLIILTAVKWVEGDV